MEGLCFYFFQIPGIEGFKFHARPQTGTYSCSDFKGLITYPVILIFGYPQHQNRTE